MRAIITEYSERTTCTWCEKDAEGVTVEFTEGFLQKGNLCWKCLQQATRVHHRQTASPPGNDATPPRSKGASPTSA